MYMSNCGCKSRNMAGMGFVEFLPLITSVIGAATGKGGGASAPAGAGTFTDELTNLIANINANSNANANIATNTNVVSPNISSQNSANIAPSINPTFVMQTNPNNSGVSPYVSAGSQGPSFTGPSQTANPYVPTVTTATPTASNPISQPIGNTPVTGALPGFDTSSGYIPGLPGTPYTPMVPAGIPATDNKLLLYGGLGLLALLALSRGGGGRAHYKKRRHHK